MSTERCPFKIGDFVRFTPTEYDLAKLPPIELYGLLPNQEGRIVAIKDGRFIYLETSLPGMGLDWEMFVAKPG